MKWIVAGLAAVLLAVAAHYAGVFEAIENLVSPPLEDASAVEAGREAAAEVESELDQESDEQVAADSAVADQHDAERRELERDAAADEAAAVDDLDRRLRRDLRDRLQEGVGK